ncbi:MAG TPA: hypothetical protein VF844_06810 [Ktedonobacteraceae bacterium]
MNPSRRGTHDAGIATRTRQVFVIKAEQVHVDTTSFSVSGEYAGAQVGEDATVSVSLKM